MQTVSFGELEDAGLTLVFGVTGPSSLTTFMGEPFMPDQVRLKYSQDSLGEDSWRLEWVDVIGWGTEPLGGRCAVGSSFQDAPVKLPAWAYAFAAGVDPVKELEMREE